jgi:GntR family transcriptional regulator
MSEEMDIVDYLVASIQSGEYVSGDKLPSEHELAEQFKVPRMTARKAYERLQELGLIYSMQGKGSFVRDRKLRIPLALSGGKSFSKKMIELGFNYESMNIFCEPVESNHKIEATLGIGDGDRVFKIGRLRKIDGCPVALHISYVAESLFPNIEHVGREISSMFEFYERHGYTDFQLSESILSITYPIKYERELLACSSLIPLLVLNSECRDKGTGRMIECSRIMYRGDMFTYEL